MNCRTHISKNLSIIRDSILTLMEIYHNGNISNILNESYAGKNYFQSLKDDRLIKAYCELIKSNFISQQITSNQKFDMKDTDNAVNNYQMYKYLMNPIVMEYIINNSEEL